MKFRIAKLETSNLVLGSVVGFLTIVAVLLGLFKEFWKDEIKLYHWQSNADKRRGEVTIINSSNRSVYNARLIFEEETKSTEIWKNGKLKNMAFNKAEIVVADTLFSGYPVVLVFTMYKPYKSEEIDFLFTGTDTKGTTLTDQERRKIQGKEALIIALILFEAIQLFFCIKIYLKKQEIIKAIEDELWKCDKLINRNGNPNLQKSMELYHNFLKRFGGNIPD